MRGLNCILNVRFSKHVYFVKTWRPLNVWRMCCHLGAWGSTIILCVLWYKNININYLQNKPAFLFINLSFFDLRCQPQIIAANTKWMLQWVWHHRFMFISVQFKIGPVYFINCWGGHFSLWHKPIHLRKWIVYNLPPFN